MREKIYNMIEPKAGSGDRIKPYDVFMVIIILGSFIPLAFREETTALRVIDGIAGVIFTIDYILRWITADFKFGRKGMKSFLKYPFTPMAIIDLLSILPIVVAIHPAFRLFRAMRLIMALRFLRVVRLFRYSKNLSIILNVLKKNRGTLLMILVLAVGYILLSSIVIFQVETEVFKNYFDAVYWSAVSLTTIGYGDYYPITELGKLVTIISSVMGVALVALPAGVITAGYLNEVRKMDAERHGKDQDQVPVYLSRIGEIEESLLKEYEEIKAGSRAEKDKDNTLGTKTEKDNDSSPETKAEEDKDKRPENMD